MVWTPLRSISISHGCGGSNTGILLWTGGCRCNAHLEECDIGGVERRGTGMLEGMFLM
jgi:hypothetical protein